MGLRELYADQVLSVLGEQAAEAGKLECGTPGMEAPAAGEGGGGEPDGAPGGPAAEGGVRSGYGGQSARRLGDEYVAAAAPDRHLGGGLAVNIYFISHVRGSTPEIYEREKALVQELEKTGCQVHWPIRDTKQDASALDICYQNVRCVGEADVVLVAGLTQGQVFDLGMAFAIASEREVSRKLVILPVPGLFPEPTTDKSIENVVWALWEALVENQPKFEWDIRWLRLFLESRRW